MISKRTRVLELSVVVKYCNNHKGPMSSISPPVMVAQVVNLPILESLWYIVVVLSKSLLGLYRVSFRFDVLGCIANFESLECSVHLLFYLERSRVVAIFRIDP